MLDELQIWRQGLLKQALNIFVLSNDDSLYGVEVHQKVENVVIVDVDTVLEEGQSSRCLTQMIHIVAGTAVFPEGGRRFDPNF